MLCLSASREGEPGPAGDEEIVVTTADTLEDLLSLAASRPFDVVMIPADLALTPVLNLLEAQYFSNSFLPLISFNGVSRSLS
ncbi:hypothetical protein [Methanofollis tationis]|uniref:Uncharacterized protein n=1 Tax=Methanofollis tationis TaxID=81417 RepID=A0A7K4HPP3_9EURY|nr:hypothetical protein [Methanofollis tationis]NVO67221.1 hypothetical protein [Methanofollis tationis]